MGNRIEFSNTPRNALRATMKNYRAIHNYFVGGQTLQRKAGTAALVALGTVAVITGLDQIAPIGEIPHFMGAVIAGLIPAICTGGLTFSIKAFLHRQTGIDARFTKAVENDATMGFPATLSWLGGLKSQEDRGIFLGQIENLAGKEFREGVVNTEIAKNDKVINLTAKRDVLNKEIDGLNKQADELNTRITGEKTEYSQRKRELDQINAELVTQTEANKTTLERLQKDVEKITAEIIELESKRGIADNAIQEEKTRCDAEMKDLKEKLAGENQKYELAVRGLAERYRGTKINQEKEIEDLGLKINELTGKKTVMEQQLDKFQKEGQAKIDDLVAQKDHLEKDIIPGLEKEVEHLTKTKEDLIDDVAKLGSDVQKQRELRQALIKQNMGIKLETKTDKRLARQKDKGGEQA